MVSLPPPGASSADWAAYYRDSQTQPESTDFSLNNGIVDPWAQPSVATPPLGPAPLYDSDSAPTPPPPMQLPPTFINGKLKAKSAPTESSGIGYDPESVIDQPAPPVGRAPMAGNLQANPVGKGFLKAVGVPVSDEQMKPAIAPAVKAAFGSKDPANPKTEKPIDPKDGRLPSVVRADANRAGSDHPEGFNDPNFAKLNEQFGNPKLGAGPTATMFSKYATPHQAEEYYQGQKNLAVNQKNTTDQNNLNNVLSAKQADLSAQYQKDMQQVNAEREANIRQGLIEQDKNYARADAAYQELSDRMKDSPDDGSRKWLAAGLGLLGGMAQTLAPLIPKDKKTGEPSGGQIAAALGGSAASTFSNVLTQHIDQDLRQHQMDIDNGQKKITASGQMLKIANEKLGNKDAALAMVAKVKMDGYVRSFDDFVNQHGIDQNNINYQKTMQHLKEGQQEADNKLKDAIDASGTRQKAAAAAASAGAGSAALKKRAEILMDADNKAELDARRKAETEGKDYKPKPLMTFEQAVKIVRGRGEDVGSTSGTSSSSDEYLADLERAKEIRDHSPAGIPVGADAEEMIAINARLKAAGGRSLGLGPLTTRNEGIAKEAAPRVMEVNSIRNLLGIDPVSKDLDRRIAEEKKKQGKGKSENQSNTVRKPAQ